MDDPYSITHDKVSDEKTEKETKRNEYDENISVTDRSEIIIVIDPGHGSSQGNTGSVYVKSYKHKLKDDSTGNPRVLDGKEQIIESEIEDLPDYVYQEIKDAKNAKQWAVKRIEDNSKLERDVVWSVALELKDILTQFGYSASLTRNEKLIKGADDRSLRTKYASDLNAHYFISIHADGSYDFKLTGSHATYRTKSSKSYDAAQKEFASDIMKYYSLISVLNKSPEKRNDLQVLSPTENLSKRKTLVELGFNTNPSDFEIMSTNANELALQLAKGLEYNISKVFLIDGKSRKPIIK